MEAVALNKRGDLFHEGDILVIQNVLVSLDAHYLSDKLSMQPDLKCMNDIAFNK